MSQVTVSSSHRDAEINEVQTGNATLGGGGEAASAARDGVGGHADAAPPGRLQPAPRLPRTATLTYIEVHEVELDYSTVVFNGVFCSLGRGAELPSDGTALHKKSKGSILEEIEDDIDNNVIDDGPARVCVYRVCGGECAAAREGARVSAVERAARRARRSLEPALAELLAAPRVLLALPVGILLRLHRCTLEAWWSLVGGCVREVAEGAVRPALAECAGGCAVPALRAARVLLREARATLRPLALALRDAAEAPARLFQALRLVHVAPCACSSHSHSHSHTLV
ncbi:uncharacterized protein LOC105842720 isoform X8 [Bombyx mori]|uniref:uncharacterized protein LOC105842720 isoform X8 n=1 Tax=Bombyx mori TaxID=7091 RepID=UPI002ED0A38B